ncbi:MogA/MoaB family molybdenum cofactor biosynthesis protein [Bacillus sp. FJAT-42376]|uniref:MogA/MoaB family molybdenum cofactor biosynthesis protein n=1 Tax=Bacillus sp. FJAT-42376 TaxID=2014076 RepID=UPI000F509733|nr:MogA/MoaB family molybdenum cofactor biosynthesis protein [Bacillus sp. FJAT-42376]AZB43134.1 MogA/MoaB family molybdenum cofactor biosynthesis protein [Bacillus sp. FJAT-42376]
MHTHDLSISVQTAVLTVSDTRTKQTDLSGTAINELLIESGHSVKEYSIVSDDIELISSFIRTQSENPEIQAIIITGGTGFTPRDVTYEAVSRLFEKEMTGFGELFRSLSYEEIGVKAMFSRAAAGSRNGCAIYALPGSLNAVKLGMTKLILPSIQHFTEELNRI